MWQNIPCVVLGVADAWQEGEVSGAVLWEVIVLVTCQLWGGGEESL